MGKEKLRRRTNTIKYCESKDEDGSASDEDSFIEPLKRKDRKLEKIVEGKVKSSEKPGKHLNKKYSDDYKDACQVECQICYQVMIISYMRCHTQSKHQLDISSYKKKYGNKYTYVVKSYHRCEICGSKLLLDQDTIASHVRAMHETSLKEYNSTYMTLKNAPLENFKETPQSQEGKEKHKKHRSIEKKKKKASDKKKKKKKKKK